MARRVRLLTLAGRRRGSAARAVLLLLAPMASACAIGAYAPPAEAPSGSAEPDVRSVAHPPKALGFPDRRPVLMIRTWNGSWSATNPWGNAPPFRGDDAGRAIATALENAYSQGWRRFMLLSPMGGPREAMLARSLTEFWRRSPAWRRVMREQLGAWTRRHPDASVGIYMGLFPRDRRPLTEEDFEIHLTPWLEMGIREFGFDATSPPGGHEPFNRAARWLKARGARAVMEAYPIENGAIAPQYLTTTPMLALRRFADAQQRNDLWRLDPLRSEVWIGVGRGEPITPAQLRQLHARGFIFLVYSLNEQERDAALRIGMGG